MNILSLIGGVAFPFCVFWLGRALFHALTLEVEDEQVVLVTRFGKHVSTLNRPGLYWLLERPAPWVRLIRVSTARDFRHFVNVHVNDSKGTSVMVDLWLELRIVDPVKATFAVADWDRALCNLVSHATTSILGNREFDEILRCRVELGALLQDEIGVDCERWGIRVEQAYLQSLGLRPEVERQILASVSARLERAKAELEENGRLAAALLEAETGARVAELVAAAKGQYPEAISRAYQAMSTRPRVRIAYDQLYGLAQVRPQRTIAFVGFNQLRPADALMVPHQELAEAGGRAQANGHAASNGHAQANGRATSNG